MVAKIILNPYSNRWNALRRKPEAEAALKNAGIEYDMDISERPGHIWELAYQAAANGYSPIVAAGGDSTYNEVANGILEYFGDDEVTIPMGILPMGTANDLPSNLGIPMDLMAAAQIIADGQTRLLDVCTVNNRHFLNNSAIGLETTVTVIQEGITRVSGVIRYLLATFIAIYKNPAWVMKLQWDDGEYEGPVKLVSIGNNAKTGGIFYTVPHANPFDGKLSFVYGSIEARLEILRTLPKIMKPDVGNYIEHPKVHEYHTTWLKIHCEPGTPAHTDGEIFDRSIQDLEYKITPARLPLLLPKH